MKKTLKLYNDDNEKIEIEIDLKEVLCFESHLDDTFTLFSKNEEHDGLVYKGTTYDLAEELVSDHIEFLSEYITEKTFYLDGKEVKEGAILKVIIYNPNNAIIDYKYVEENKYDVSIMFLDEKQKIKCQYETYWGDEELFWYKNFKNQLEDN